MFCLNNKSVILFLNINFQLFVIVVGANSSCYQVCALLFHNIFDNYILDSS